MSENNELMVRDDAQRMIEITPEAEAMKADALACAGLIGKVRNAAEQESAVEAQMSLKKLLSLVEKSRKDVKEPVIKFGREIDAKAKAFRDELEAEFKRVSRAVSDFQMLEAQKARAAEAARIAELNRIEKEREEAIAKAKSVEEVDAIQEDANNKAAEECSKVEKAQPVKQQGQVVREVWEFEVTDIHTLARAHPNCVRITPMPGEIKQLLAMGVTVQGVKSWKETKASVRVA